MRLDLHGCLLRDNEGLIDLDPWAGDGGAVMVKGVSGAPVGVTVAECEFRGNFAAQGAGLYMGRFATGDVTRCRFLGNVAYLQGGATFKGGALVINRGETATFTYCEFIGNRAGLAKGIAVSSPPRSRRAGRSSSVLGYGCQRKWPGACLARRIRHRAR